MFIRGYSNVEDFSKMKRFSTRMNWQKNTPEEEPMSRVYRRVGSILPKGWHILEKTWTQKSCELQIAFKYCSIFSLSRYSVRHL